ncbi:MAG: efflux RND transporter periplasmic adaptor subunit [Magnetovibrio sp.]|nr:efflux RND transporter periplasmic adaptor subunit [Magnetovibrio sp.]
MLNLKTIAPLAAMILLSGCQDEVTQVESPVRAIKTFTVSEVAGGNTRQYSGKLVAGTTASLSFSVSGRVASVDVQTGDRVTKGQTLASLDRETFLLDIEAAQAELNKARSSHREKNQDHKRKRQLAEKGWVTKAAVEQSLSALETATSQVSYAQSQLSRVNRALLDSIIAAPFDGVIAERLFDPYMDVSGGQQVFSIEGTGALEVAIGVPERTIAQLHLGIPATVTFSANKGLKVPGLVTEIGMTAGPGSIFPVKITLGEAHPSLRTGMSAEVTLSTRQPSGDSGYMVPLASIAPGNKEAKGYVFVFDKKTKQVNKTPINPQGIGRENFVAVKGINAGDILAAAGVSFLSDGQIVKLMPSSSR